MKFGPLVYRNPAGIYAEDPDTVTTQVKMEKALVSQASRYIRKGLACKDWVIHEHGTCPGSMTLDVEFHILTGEDLSSLIAQAIRVERGRVANEIVRLLRQ